MLLLLHKSFCCKGSAVGASSFGVWAFGLYGVRFMVFGLGFRVQGLAFNPGVIEQNKLEAKFSLWTRSCDCVGAV